MAKSFTKIGSPLGELEVAREARLQDAEVLLQAGRFGSAIAMGLYTLEIALKIAICRRLDLPHLPEAFFIHELDELLILSGLSNKIRSIKRPRGVFKNWEDLLQLARNIERFRYTSDPGWDEPLARRVLRQLRDPPDGLLLWLEKQH